MAISLILLVKRAQLAATRGETQLAGPVSGHRGYRAGGGHRPLAAAMALGVVGVVGAGLVTALVMPALVPTIDPPLTASNIPITVIDDPVERARPDQPRRTTTTARNASDTTVVRDSTATAFPSFGDGPLVDVGSGGGASGDGEIIFEPRAEPVAQPIIRPARRDPRFAAAFQPRYPFAAEREGIEGRCTVNVSISANGRVSAVRRIDCPNDDFFAATQRHAIERWRFQPATHDGVAIETTLTQSVLFEITGDSQR